MAKPSANISSLTFSDGRSYTLEANEKILIVGPNNSGKSLALREIRNTLSSNPTHDPYILNKCIKGVSLSKSGSPEDLKDFIITQGVPDLQKGAPGEYYSIGPYSIYKEIFSWFGGIQLGELSQLYCRYIGTENRLGATAVSSSIAAGSRPTTAQQILYENEKLFRRVSSQFRASFGQSLVIDYRGGNSIPIHVGEAPILAAGEDRISDTYVSRVRALPRLDEQGDGMRGYAGILFEATVTTHDITLLDEPEAFLHPPQMRRLGRTLAEHVDGQLLVATHSSDILRGFLDASDAKVRIIRLQRGGEQNISRETAAEVLRELWQNPDLKYSNALESIFHELCIICEDDSDCRFYNAVSDHLSSSSEDEHWPDSIYVPCGGKHAIPKLAGALYTLGVPVKIVVDLDALSEEVLLSRLVRSVGGDWEAIKKDWRIFSAGVLKGVTPKTEEEIKTGIRQLLDEEVGLPKSKIMDVMKRDSAWNILKNAGADAIPKGESRAAFERLRTELQKMGIFAVHVGQIEGFIPSLGGHGPSFVSTALKTIDLNRSEWDSAKTFVASFAGPVAE